MELKLTELRKKDYKKAIQVAVKSIQKIISLIGRIYELYFGTA